MSYIEIVSGAVHGDASSVRLDALADYGYSIRIENDLFDPANPVFARVIDDRPSLIVLSPTVDRLHGQRIRAYAAQWLAADRTTIITCPTGEKNKTIETVVDLCAAAKACSLDRDGLFIGIGGGIVLDLVGFAASIYRRGTKFIKVPTTLVGQVDVAVGLKTGVNALRSKNILGSYYPAFLTLNDPTFLDTLPARELRCGMAEVIKMGLACDQGLFDLIDAAQIRGGVDANRIDYAIHLRAMLRMAEELQPNLLEAELERAVDFGHSFSMRFEIESDHRLLHGEAVAIDMALSCCIAAELGWMTGRDCTRAIEQIQRAGLAIWDDEVCTIENLEASIEDVRLHRQAVNLVLPTTIGHARFVKHRDELAPDILDRALAALSHHARTAVAS